MPKQNAALNKIARILRWGCDEKFPAALVGFNQEEVKKNINKACREVAKEILANIPLMMDKVWLCVFSAGGEDERTVWANKEECYAYAAKQLREWIQLDRQILDLELEDDVQILDLKLEDDVQRVNILNEIELFLGKDRVMDAIQTWNDSPEWCVGEEEPTSVNIFELPLYGC